MNRFIVGTGRCGSTLLSTMLAKNPEVLSLFEYFNGLDAARRFQDETMGGAAYRDLICEVHPFLHPELARGYDVPEVTFRSTTRPSASTARAACPGCWASPCRG